MVLSMALCSCSCCRSVGWISYWILVGSHLAGFLNQGVPQINHGSIILGPEPKKKVPAVAHRLPLHGEPFLEVLIPLRQVGEESHNPLLGPWARQITNHSETNPLKKKWKSKATSCNRNRNNIYIYNTHITYIIHIKYIYNYIYI